MEYGFRTFGFERLISVAQPANRASIRVMEKLGMTFDRRFLHKDIEVVAYSKENPAHVSPPSPGLFFHNINAFQSSSAMRAGIELDLFTRIGEGAGTPAELAPRVGAAERGVRILCDYLTVAGFLTKDGGRYGLTPDTAAFLDRRSPSYLGGVTEFLHTRQLVDAFDNLTAAVRKGGTALAGHGTVEDNNDVWVAFARAMAPMMAMPAELLAKLVNGESTEPLKVLDVAAGHGLFGIALARLNPGARVVATDWAAVLDVARQNADAAGVGDRVTMLSGSAFDLDFGKEAYDVVLLTNILHHFDPPTCEKLLRKVHAALKPGGRAVTLEFVPDEDRVSPPESAMFALTMLATTPAGDAYTFAEYQRMFAAAGFARSEFHPLPPTMQQVVIAHRR
jgi:2-polyprenyl-3-methyl-5-hydroxy-6-metoxy-1,4-benzoquinol methylase